MSIIPLSCQPDSISFLPDSDDILVATYTYTKGVRIGSLMVLQLEKDISNRCIYRKASKLQLDCGILHAKPHKINGKIYSICAASDGSVKFAKYDDMLSIEHSTLVDSNALDTISERVTSGLSTGKIALIDRNRVLQSWPGHELEVWTCYMDGNLIYTGSDDSKLRIWDVATSPTNFKNCIAEIKSFGAGVTWISATATEVIAGSHDNTLTWFDKRSMRCELRRLKVPGSPWKLVNYNSIFYAALCQGLIYAFTDKEEVDAVAGINDKLRDLFENTPTTGHEPLIYSLDVRDKMIIATDFYNKRLIVADSIL